MDMSRSFPTFEVLFVIAARHDLMTALAEGQTKKPPS